MVHSTPTLANLPSEMIAAVQVDAERQAEAVAEFVGTLGENLLPPSRRTPHFLLQFAAALRLRRWEAEGFFFHREVGLPEADQAVREALASPNAGAADPTEFCLAVLRLTLERFAWSGPRKLGVDVAVKEANEDALLEALAEFLWTHRPR